MHTRNVRYTIALLASVLFVTVPAASVPTEGVGSDGTVVWVKNFGGSELDVFEDVIAVSDGFVAVGFSGKFDKDWTAAGVRGNGGNDAVIVKFDSKGTVAWAKNFGGSGDDRFCSVTQASDGGYVAVGFSDNFNKDWVTAGVTGGGGCDATIVKFNTDGTVAWAKNYYGGPVDDRFNDVITVPDGFIAVGHSFLLNFAAGKIGVYATAVKFGEDGTLVWEKSFGGAGSDYFLSVAPASDGFAAVGYSDVFNRDWAAAGVTGKGGRDATIVKFDLDGRVTWANNFGGSDWDVFTSVTRSSDGFVAAGRSYAFDGDWAAEGVTGKGDADATAVKFDLDGMVEWATNFGGSGFDNFASITHVSGGYLAAGYSDVFDEDFAAAGIKGKGGVDATVVMFNSDGTVAWAKNFGGSGDDGFTSAAAAGDGLAAVGYSYAFDKDWAAAGVKGKGEADGIIMRYGSVPFVPVTNITGVPSSKTVEADLTLTGKAVPSEATNKTITWKVKDAGGTGAKIIKNKLSTALPGTVIITATIMDGIAMNEDFTMDFQIAASDAFVAVTDIVGVPDSVTAGAALTLTGTVLPSNATNTTITWTVRDARTTGAAIIENELSSLTAGSVIVTATVSNGTAPGTSFTKDFEIVIDPAPAEGGSGSALLLTGMVAVLAVISVAASVLMGQRIKRRRTAL